MNQSWYDLAVRAVEALEAIDETLAGISASLDGIAEALQSAIPREQDEGTVFNLRNTTAQDTGNTQHKSPDSHSI